MKETFEQKTERNIRAQNRYDDLMRIGRHGHYETMSSVIREEVEREHNRLRAALDPLARSADTAVVLLKKDYPGEAASLNAHVAVARVALGD